MARCEICISTLRLSTLKNALIDLFPLVIYDEITVPKSIEGDFIMKNMIGENIKIMRCKCGFTQEELATRLSVTPQAISKWENGGSLS